LEDGDGAVLASAADAFLVERGVGARFLHVEVAAAVQRTFLDQQHLEACRAEDFRAGGASCTAADDGDIGFQRDIPVEPRAVVGFPAACEAFGEGISYRH